MITTLARVVLLSAIAVSLTACRGPHGEPVSNRFVYVTLKTGPKSGSYTKEQSQEIFAGHMNNMKRLADESKLLIAGPFASPADKTWRGIFVFDTETIADARRLVATDPGVVAEVFVTELTPMYASRSIRTTLALEKKLTSQPQPPPDPTKPPPNVRAYVLITAQDWVKAGKALAATPAAGRVIWTGSFDGDRYGQGVFVLDAEKPETVKAALAAADTGPCAIDGWWSTTSLTGLPPQAGH